MIDIISLRESYKKRENSKIRRINSKYNLVDALIKKTPNLVLEKLVSTNQLIIRVEVFVNRTKDIRVGSY